MVKAIAIAHSMPWRLLVSDPTALRLPTDAQAMLDQGRPFSLAARASSYSGARSRELVIQDLHGAADELARQQGVDCRPMLPPNGELDMLLQEADTVRSPRSDGKPDVANRFVEIDLRSKAGLIILISTGSGHLLDAEGNQPFIQHAAAFVRRFAPALYYTKRFDRGMGRQTWALAPLAIALEAVESFAGDEDGVHRCDEARGFFWFIKGTQGRKVATVLPKQVRLGQISRTDTEMIGGQARYHLPSAAPPGFATAWLKSQDALRPARRMLFLDTDGCRPPDERVAHGMPEVRHPDGTRVDQVATVRFVLARYGTPQWPVGRLVRELRARRFSTEGLRSHNGPDAVTPEDERAARSVLMTILANLDLYETGVLQRSLGPWVDPVTIHNCMPTDSDLWAAPEDFARIRRSLRQERDRSSHKSRLTFTGATATYNGADAVMRAGRHRRPSTPLAYSFRRGNDPDAHAVDGSMLLPADAWARSLVRGIRSAGDQALKLVALLDTDEGADDGLSALKATAVSLEARRTAANAEMTALFGRLAEITADGQPVLTGALLQHTQARYNELAETVIPEIDQEVERNTQQIDDLLSRRPDGADVSQLLHLVASLRDATDLAYRGVWLANLNRVRFWTELTPGGKPHTLHWSGELLITEGEQTYRIPFQGTYERPKPGSRPNGHVSATGHPVVEALRAGAPPPAMTAATVSRRVRALADTLAIPEGRILLGQCTDPRISRAALTVLERIDESDEAIARQLDEPVEFITRIRAIHTPPTNHARWNTPGTRVVSALYALGAANDGHTTAQAAAEAADTTKQTVYTEMNKLLAAGHPWETERKRGYRLKPCACGSHRRAPMTIPEPNGPVCLDCRTDLSGLIWPADPYDTYVAHPDLWGLADHE